MYIKVSLAQGPSAGMAFDILQDREGFIWVATKSISLSIVASVIRSISQGFLNRILA
jgi:hypothetical protein